MLALFALAPIRAEARKIARTDDLPDMAVGASRAERAEAVLVRGAQLAALQDVGVLERTVVAAVALVGLLPPGADWMCSSDLC